MKILFLARRFYPLIGGVEKHCLEVGKRLVKKGYEVTIVTEGKDGREGIEGKGEVEGIRVYRIPITMSERLKKFQIWQWLFKNRKLIREANIVHCHDVFFWYLPFRFLYPRKKVFTTFHGWEGVFPPTYRAKLARKISEKLSFGNICVGKYLEKWYNTKADYITYGGIEINNYESIDKDNSKKFKILYLGKFEQTWIRIYLKALDILERKLENLEVRFIGEGSLKRKAGAMGEVLGLLDNPMYYIGRSDIVFTSGYLSTLESLANHRTVFAIKDNDLKRDIFEMSPFAKWIIIESDPEKLAQKVIDYKNGKLKIDIEGAYNWAKKQTWEKVADLYLKLWGLR